jgi:hypothetical protein
LAVNSCDGFQPSPGVAFPRLAWWEASSPRPQDTRTFKLTLVPDNLIDLFAIPDTLYSYVCTHIRDKDQICLTAEVAEDKLRLGGGRSWAWLCLGSD